MGPRKKKKVKKYRGTRTCGGGSHKKRRGAGSRGGRGRAGSHKHHYIKMIKMGWEFGKHGFTRPKVVRKYYRSSKILRKNLEMLMREGKIDKKLYRFFCSKVEMNVGDLDAVIEKLVSAGLAKVENGKYIVDLEIIGYKKLLGRGTVNKAIVVKVLEATETASRKIKEAGGDVILPEGEINEG